MLAHRLRHRIAFQMPLQVQGDDGNNTVEWVAAVANGVELLSVPAEVLTGPGRESVEAGSKQAEVAARINCRWFPGLSQAWRILWDDQVFNIVGKSTDASGRQEWRLVCSAGLSDGR